MPLDVEFMLDDLIETLRPKGRPKGSKDGMVVDRLHTFPEAAAAVDELLATNGPGEYAMRQWLTVARSQRRRRRE
jgi:hypothetical protein